jgi:uncharacterized protein YndB with AHSA1/START domain
MTGIEMIEMVETFDGSPDDVWPMVSDPELLREWLDDDVELTLEVGAPLRTSGAGGARVGVVDDVEVGRRLVFTWMPIEPEPGPASTVEMDLERDADGNTVLRIRERVVEAERSLATLPDDGEFRALARR